jgi:hypothetical protein
MRRDKKSEIVKCYLHARDCGLLQRAAEGDAPFTMADFRHYMHQAEERQFNIDHEKIKV